MRKQLVGELACPFGTLAGRSVWPPQRWERDRWFLPTTFVNVDYIRDLYADGARAAEQFVTTRVNPSDEITLRFMGGLLAGVDADAQGLQRAAVEATYEPRDGATLDGLVEMVQTAEQAYFKYSGRDLASRAGLFYVDGGLTPKVASNPPTYLLDMSRADRGNYVETITRMASNFEKLRPAVGQKETGERTARCFRSMIADVERIESM